MPLNYEIRREAHAIGEFAATLTFSNAVSVNAFAAVVPRLRDVAEWLKLPAPMNMQMFNFALGPGMPVAMPPATGSGFQRFQENGEVAASLWCDQNSITFTLRDYDTWLTVLPTIVRSFSELLPGYLIEVPAVSRFTVQYLNEFRAKEASIQNPTELFKSGSPWVAPFAYGIDDHWHCHIGRFIEDNDAYRFLINVNCDISAAPFPPDQTVKNYVRVLLLAACYYDVPGKGPLVLQPEMIEEALRSNFDSAHSLEKKLLSEVISSEYLAIMGERANEY